MIVRPSGVIAEPAAVGLPAAKQRLQRILSNDLRRSCSVLAVEASHEGKREIEVRRNARCGHILTVEHPDSLIVCLSCLLPFVWTRPSALS